MLQISASAAEEFKRLLANKSQGASAVRVFTVGGGCCGPSVAMDLVAVAQPGDVSLEQEGVQVHLEPAAATALEQATLDFNAKGFTIRNPAASGCCG